MSPLIRLVIIYSDEVCTFRKARLFGPDSIGSSSSLPASNYFCLRLLRNEDASAGVAVFHRGNARTLPFGRMLLSHLVRTILLRFRNELSRLSSSLPAHEIRNSSGVQYSSLS